MILLHFSVLTQRNSPNCIYSAFISEEVNTGLTGAKSDKESRQKYKYESRWEGG